MKIREEWLLLLGSLLVVAALYNHYLGHSAYLVEIFFMVVGTSLALYSLRAFSRLPEPTENGILMILLGRFMTKKWVTTVLPALGFAIIFAWSVWKLAVAKAADLQMEDFIVTLFGLSLVLYHSGPSRFTMQKDFVVLYLMFLTIVFAVIWKMYTAMTGESYVRITAYSEYYLITWPVVSIVNLFGVGASSELDLSGHGLSNLIIYEYQGRSIYLGIGTGCSGLYAAGLFFSAFLAFVIVRYRNLDRYVMVALLVGFAVTWVSNIIRMVVTILVGSAYGHPALVFVHSYIGIIIFVVFITLFWFPIVKWLDRKEAAYKERSAAPIGTESQS